MKKLLTLLFLMTISLGYSQTFPLDFSDPADLFGGFEGVSTSIVDDGGNNVLQIVGGTGTWDNSQLNLAQNINLSDNNNNTITFRFKASAGSSGQHLLKFEGLSGAGAAVAEGFFNSTGTAWQTITINFGAGLGNYSKVVIFTDSGAASNGWNNTGTGTYLVDDLAGGTNVIPVVIPAPTTAAPTPTDLAANVLSIFSNAYTNVVGTAFAPNWGQNPTFQQVNIAGNATNRYLNFNFVGNTFSAGGVNASSMQQLHLDIWTPDCTAFDVYILDGTAPDQKVTLTPTLSEWNSFDIDLSNFSSLTKSAIVEFKFERADTGVKTIYLDNIYFWKAPAGTFTYYSDVDSDGYGAGAAVLMAATTAPDGYSANNSDCAPLNPAINPGATEIADGIDNNCNGVIDEGFPPSMAAPAPPVRNAWDVISIFSGAYSNVTINELPTSWSQLAIAPFSVESIAGNATWKFGGEFLGMQINAPGIDLNQMTMMHIDYWTPDNKIMIVKIVNTVNGGEANTIVQDPVVTGTWRSVDIPMAQFGASLNKSKITQILLDPQLGGSTVYVDNLYFYRPTTAAPSPTITNFSVPGKVVGAATFTITAPTSNSAGAFTYTSSNPAVATIVNGNKIQVNGVGTSSITATQAANGNYGSGFTSAPFVVSFPNPSSIAPFPAMSGSRVISVFSDAYTNVAGTDFFQQWGGPTIGSNLQQSGNNRIQKYTNFTYVGTQFASPINASGMEMLHLDIWTPDCSAFQVYLISNGENAVTLNPTLSGWNSFDIDLSLYSAAGRNLSAIQQFKFERGGAGSKTVYLDNIYFFNTYTKVQTSQCGQTLAALNTDIKADFVSGAQEYRFKVVGNGATQEIPRGTSRFVNLTALTAGVAYNTAYTISVCVKYKGNWMKYGTECVVTTPALPKTKVRTSQCNQTLAALNTDIWADNLQFATEYRFNVTPMVPGGVTQEIPRGSSRFFNLTALTAGANYNTSYTISVAVKINGVWGDYGTDCVVTTPMAPTTSVQMSQCGQTLPAVTTDIVANALQFAADYDFKVVVNGTPYSVNPIGNKRWFKLTDLPIPVTAGTTYKVSVAVQFNGVWENHGAECDVTTPGTSPTSRQATTSIATADFSLAAYPNPSNSAFKLQVNGANDDAVSILVFDMTGRQIDNKVVKSNDIENISIGQNYSTGIYNVIVSQGTNTKTVRLVKQ